MGTALASTQAMAGPSAGRAGCENLPSHAQLKYALAAAVAGESSGLDFDMWGTIVNRDGVVCAVAFSGTDRGSQWPGSRVISAQKANTANAFSLDSLALSTGNLYSAAQGTSGANAETMLGGSLYGLQFSNPVNPDVAYGGNPKHYGQANDPMVGKRPGGVNVFGGGLGLYKKGRIIGAVGVSGDTSCADHNIAWRVRKHLKLDQMQGVGGVSGDPDRPDNIILDQYNGNNDGVTAGFEQPGCLNDASGDPRALPAVQH
ncbi:uncharacterized protein sS8_4970 [Methylocaldum marinum]|uniref:Heme-binding protein n=1 Tax=Methylocaldum marinum TaxID=1432792 RepID=A0A250KYZ0_9GAMM|nr:heme-binding protein [Methylocaldum marinum]BBA36893.1 uncharacterized protein sS8_4970 [Methylocaldum marinum]